VLKAIWFVLGGMGITFATLALLMLTMTVLNRWLRPGPEAGAKRAGPARD